MNMTLPRVTWDQEKHGKNVSLNNLLPGDLLYWGNRGASTHVAIYIGNGQYIHAPRPGQNVQIGEMKYWAPDFAKRLISDESVSTANVHYTTRVRGNGWADEVKNGTTSGSVGQNLPLEGLCVAIKNQNVSGDVSYRTHVSNKGWLDWKANGTVSGGAGERVEAVQLKLTGELAKQYMISYRVHVQDIGWMDWVKDGQTGGTTGKNKQVEAIQIKLVKK